MMEHLNYCRQMLKQFNAGQHLNPGGPHAGEVLARSLCATAMKFQLPDGGHLIDDKELRALDGAAELSLPYECVALEYARVDDHDEDQESKNSAVITFAQQFENEIVVLFAFRIGQRGQWIWVCHEKTLRIPRRGFIDRAVKGRSGFPGIHLYDDDAGEFDDLEENRDGICVLLGFLNAVSCSNVRVEKSAPKKAGKKIKAALPFDTYHILTIDVSSKAGDGAATGGHRSPREHLRRGHIRRLGDGRRIWVNATVVAAWRGAGAVTKDYAVRCAA